VKSLFVLAHVCLVTIEASKIAFGRFKNSSYESICVSICQLDGYVVHLISTFIFLVPTTFLEESSASVNTCRISPYFQNRLAAFLDLYRITYIDTFSGCTSPCKPKLIAIVFASCVRSKRSSPNEGIISSGNLVPVSNLVVYRDSCLVLRN